MARISLHATSQGYLGEPHTRSQRAPSTRLQRAATSVKQGAGLADDGGGDADLQLVSSGRC